MENELYIVPCTEAIFVSAIFPRTTHREAGYYHKIQAPRRLVSAAGSEWARMKLFTTLTEEEVREFWRLYRLYWREAKRCEKANAYLAGCVMLGSALESLLILMVDIYDDEAVATGKAPKKGGKLKPLLDWNLGELLKVAKSAGWLPAGLDLDDDWDGRKAKVGDYAEVARMVRNLDHPGRYRKGHFRGRVTERYLRRQFDVVEASRDWLAHHNEESLLKHMKEEEAARARRN